MAIQRCERKSHCTTHCGEIKMKRSIKPHDLEAQTVLKRNPAADCRGKGMGREYEPDLPSGRNGNVATAVAREANVCHRRCRKHRPTRSKQESRVKKRSQPAAAMVMRPDPSTHPEASTGHTEDAWREGWSSFLGYTSRDSPRHMKSFGRCAKHIKSFDRPAKHS